MRKKVYIGLMGQYSKLGRAREHTLGRMADKTPPVAGSRTSYLQ